MEALKLGFLFLSVSSIANFPTMRAGIAVFDETWHKRAAEAKNASIEAYEPNPAHVTNHFNLQVHKFTENGGHDNATRRELGAGGCQATTPIDRCWRCDKNWAKNRKKLAGCVIGFGRKTTGGKKGRYYVVTDSSDSDLVNPKPGTLRHAVIQREPLWIIFAHSMVIRLSQELMVTSDKTIDGRGSNVHIAFGAQITLQFVKNVIIHNLHIHDIKAGNGGMVRDSVDHFGFRTKSDGDGISMFGATNVWIDHVSMRNCMDGLIDAIMRTTAVTISNCHFTNHNEAMLFGASASHSEDKVMQITLAFNHFGQGLVQRMPRCRFGFFHIVNNDYTHWRMYAIGGSHHPTIISQGNRFIAPADKHCKEVTKRDYATKSEWKNWNWRSEGDLLMNGAFFVQSGRKVTMPKQNIIKAKPGSHVTKLARDAGFLECVPGKPC